MSVEENLKDLVEEKRKQMESELTKLRSEWCKLLTKEFLDDKIASAIAHEERYANLINLSEARGKYGNSAMKLLIDDITAHILNVYNHSDLRVYTDPDDDDIYIKWVTYKPDESCFCQ